MGVVYKLKPEVLSFIIEKKQNNPALSCRHLTPLIIEQFHIKVSKSSINAIFKEKNLSMPIGRRPKQKKKKFNMPPLPVIEGVKAITLVEQPSKLIQENETAKKELNLEEKRIKDAEEWAMKLQEEERIRVEEKLNLEKQRLKDEDIKIKVEEAKKIEEQAHRESEEAEKQSRQAEEEEKRKAEEELAKKAEEEKWARLAEEEKKKKEEPKLSPALSIDKIYQMENSGIVLLKAADYVIGASKLIAAAIKSRFPDIQGNLEELVENLIYLPLFQEKAEKPFINKLSGYLEKIENIKVMNLDISRIITSSLQEARCVKVVLSDGANLYLDAQMYSVWSSPHIPQGFASPIRNLKRYINQYFNEDYPVVLFNAPGYDMPSPELFTFLEALDAKGKAITNLVISGNKFEELEVLPITRAEKRFFIFGIWPWQFTEYRKIKKIGEFRNFYLEEQDKNFYIADIEIELQQPVKGKQMVFNGCVLKTNLNEKIRLAILSNFPSGAKLAEELVSIYFNHWPNLEEAFQDYSHKIELSAYTANSGLYFSAENMNLGLAQATTVKELLASYLKALDIYVRWRLLPPGYEDKEFTATKERFYNLIVESTRKGKGCLVKFLLPPAYAFDKDLSYSCHRINEKEVVLSSGLKLYLKTD